MSRRFAALLLRAGRSTKQARKELHQRMAHVEWCFNCGRQPSFEPDRPHGELVPCETEVVFCRRCPRMLCKDCYVNGVGADEDKSKWVRLCGVLE